MIVRSLLAAALLLGLLIADGTVTVSSQEPDPEAIARAHLNRARLGPIGPQEDNPGLQQRSAAPSISANDRGLVHLATQESPGAHHVRFQETEDGIPIFGAHVVVNLKKGSDEVGYVSDERTEAPVASSALVIGEDEARDIALAAAEITRLRGNANGTQVYYPLADALYLAWQFVLPASEPLGDWLVIVLAEDGDVALVTNVATMDSGRVFDPNPVATGGPQGVSHCDSTTNESVLDDQYVVRTLLGIDSGQNLLVGEYVDLTAPGIVDAYLAAGQASSASHNFLYDCNQNGFEEVMVYYHVDTTQRRIQALGFSETSAILDEPIPAHAHYYSTCNAFYSPVDTGLHFGDCGSGVHDTAEDGDVIIHEYGHAIQDDQVPGWGFGDPLLAEQARAMGEGFSDFLAAAMTASPCIGDWVTFGSSTCSGAPGLRYLQNSKTYPGGYTSCPDNPDGSEEEHCGGELWGAALWDLAEALGNDDAARDLALTLVLDSHFYLGPQATFNDGVCAIFAADSDLYGGANGAVIANVFSNRGINCTAVPPPEFPYAFLRVRHTWVGDLVINIKAGEDPNAPDCNILIWDRAGDTNNSADDVVGFVGPLDETVCASSLPPSEDTPWWLEVRDMATHALSPNSGTIEDFEIVLSGTVRCIADDTPIVIPNGSPGAIVRSMTDCTTHADTLTNGFLRVTTSPALPAQIKVDGVPSDSWGLTWVKLLPGEYTVSFTGFEGFSSPASQQVTVTEGATTTVNGTFTQRGFLRVITNPAVPATIYVDGIPRNDWGVWTDLDPGTYDVCYGEVEDYEPPPCEEAVVTAGTTTTVTGDYTELIGEPGPTNFGMLRVETSPPVRSQIYVDGEPMDTWGLTWVKLSPGAHTVSFGDVSEFSTPASQDITITDGATTTVVGTFVRNGLLQVATSPAVPATIFVDGVPRNDWGVWTALPPGTYQVCYGTVDGYDPPPCQNASVSSGANTLVQGSYSAVTVAASEAGPSP